VGREARQSRARQRWEARQPASAAEKMAREKEFSDHDGVQNAQCRINHDPFPKDLTDAPREPPKTLAVNNLSNKITALHEYCRVYCRVFAPFLFMPLSL
jgi:hypothetical protein